MTPFDSGLDLVLQQLTAQKRLLHSKLSASPATLLTLIQAGAQTTDKSLASAPSIKIPQSLATSVDLLFIGEAPAGETDPFAGEAGQLLSKMIQAMKIPARDVAIYNLVKPQDKKRATPEEMAANLDLLKAETIRVQPKVIVALGSTAAELLTGEKRPMSDWLGQWTEFHNTPLLITYHPSYLLHNSANTEKRKVWEVLLLAMEKLALPITSAQRNFFLK